MMRTSPSAPPRLVPAEHLASGVYTIIQRVIKVFLFLTRLLTYLRRQEPLPMFRCPGQISSRVNTPSPRQVWQETRRNDRERAQL